jgi:hemolysin activation/secretion protein
VNLELEVSMYRFLVLLTICPTTWMLIPTQSAIARPLTQSSIKTSSASPNQPLTKFILAQADPVIKIEKIEVSGSSIFKAEITKIIDSYLNKTLAFEDLNAIADAITTLYVNNGFINTLAILPPQTIANGIVKIQVIEGRVDEIKIEGLQRLNPDYVISRVKLATLSPFNRDSLEDQLKLLRVNPLFANIEASLRPSDRSGQSILIIKATEANPFSTSFSTDNYNPTSIGGEKFGASLTYLNLFEGVGDRISVGYNRSYSGGLSQLDFNYQIPLNAMNGTLDFRYSPTAFRITDPAFSDLNIRGNSDLLEFNFRQPLIRSPREEFALSLGFSYLSGQSFVFDNLPFPAIGADANGATKTSVLKFAQDYLSRDPAGAWGLRSQFNFGLGIFDATSNPNPIPSGQFFSWLLQGQRVQTLDDNNLLIFQTDLQLTPNNLLPSQQFVIGGGQSVRGFRQNARIGDNGVRLSVENRFTVQRNALGDPVLQLVPFLDAGVVWNNQSNPNINPSQNFLAGAGIGVIWEPIKRLTARLEYALPFINLSDRSSNIQDSALYFSLNYRP